MISPDDIIIKLEFMHAPHLHLKKGNISVYILLLIESIFINIFIRNAVETIANQAETQIQQVSPHYFFYKFSSTLI